MGLEKFERWPGWSARVPSWTDIWLGPAIPSEWGTTTRPKRHELNLYWDEPEKLHDHWIVRSGAMIDPSFAGMDQTCRSWSPTEQHLKDRSQAFHWWSNYDSSGKTIGQVPYLLRAVSGTHTEVAMEALCTLSEHLFHQGTVAGGVSFVLPVLAELLRQNLTKLGGSVSAFLSLAQMPHVRKILPEFSPPAERTDMQVRYRLPSWGVLPNEVETTVGLRLGALHGSSETHVKRVKLDHQLPFSDQGKVGWQNELQVDGEFREISTFKNGVKEGHAEIRIGKVVIESGTLVPGRQNRGSRVGDWKGAWPDGSRRFQANYLAGGREGTVRTFAPDGTVLTECGYQKNKRVGPWRQLFPGGMLITEGQFTGNRPSGVWKGGYPDGSPRFHGKFRDGLRFGVWSYFSLDGECSEMTHDYD